MSSSSCSLGDVHACHLFGMKGVDLVIGRQGVTEPGTQRFHRWEREME